MIIFLQPRKNFFPVTLKYKIWVFRLYRLCTSSIMYIFCCTEFKWQKTHIIFFRLCTHAKHNGQYICA